MSVPSRSRGITTIQAKRSAVSRHVLLPAQAVIHNEVVSGLTLLVAAVAALAWANSPWVGAYRQFQDMIMTVGAGSFAIELDVKHWINDGLMTLFFFVVGLEIKRELTRGELNEWRRAALPMAGAVGGMVLPALIYVGFNFGSEGSSGWGIPMATDIAFALGVLALLGDRIPFQLRVFLLALAIVDDIGAILVIAIFYTAHLSLPALALATLLLGLLLAMRWGGMRNIAVYLVVVVLLWVTVLKSGIHATIGGVILGALTPAQPSFDRGTFAASAAKRVEHFAEALRQGATERAEAVLGEIEELTRMTESPLDRLQRIIHPWVSYLVLPLFALANAGVALSSSMLRDATASPVTLGIVSGLVIGKLAGIVGFSWLAVRTGMATLSKDITWPHLIGVGILGGIGFTVSLFITGLAFEEASLRVDAKVGVLAASLVAGVAGYGWLYWATKRFH